VIERDVGIELDNGAFRKSTRRRFNPRSRMYFCGGDAAFGPKNIIWSVEHWPPSSHFDTQVSARGTGVASHGAGCDVEQPQMGMPRMVVQRTNTTEPRAPVGYPTSD